MFCTTMTRLGLYVRLVVELICQRFHKNGVFAVLVGSVDTGHKWLKNLLFQKKNIPMWGYFAASIKQRNL